MIRGIGVGGKKEKPDVLTEKYPVFCFIAIAIGCNLFDGIEGYSSLKYYKQSIWIG